MPNTQNYGKTALIEDVTASTTGYSRRQVAEIVEATLNTIAAKVASGQAVTLTGFGTFRATERAARTGTNLHTKQKIQIPASRSVRFTAGSTLKGAVKGQGSTYAKERAASR